MPKTSILIFVESRYQVNRKRMKSTLVKVLDEHGVKSDAEVSVAIVGDRKMRSLNKKYRDKDATTNVLSFPLNEGTPAKMAITVIKFGDIIISYPQVIREASAEDMLVDEKVDELLVHGMKHLMGIHHQ